jgi:hypothetical protein
LLEWLRLLRIRRLIVPKPNRVIDDRLKIASASFRGARERNDAVLTDFWSREVDRLLDAKNDAKAMAPT